MKYVYLAGPIAGCDEAEAKDWRAFASSMFLPGIVGVSPLRCEPAVSGNYAQAYPEDRKFGSNRVIAAKNMIDTKAAAFVLAYLPKPEPGRRYSFGTIIEIAWAKALGVPVILVSDDPALNEHPLVDFCCDWKLPTLEDAAEVINGILGVYGRRY